MERPDLKRMLKAVERRQIFGYALEWHGPNYIRRRLEENQIPRPTWWNRKKGLRNIRTKWKKKDPVNGQFMWDFSVIKELLIFDGREG